MKILALSIIVMSTSAILYIKENEDPPETPTTVINEDLLFDCPYVYNGNCNPKKYEFYLGDLQLNSELSTSVNFSSIQSTLIQPRITFVITPTPDAAQGTLANIRLNHQYYVDIPSNVETWVNNFSLFVGKSNNYYYLISPPGPLSGQYNFSVTVVLIHHPPSFYSRTWWIIGLYFLTLFLIPVVINRHSKSKYRTYRMQQTDNTSSDLRELIDSNDV
jgi:hypothetical protein